MCDSSNDVTNVNSFKATGFDSDYAGYVIDFEVSTFDVRASKLSLSV